jgi:1-acyl-sn-glycerol-3-phosphate acyltransferase
LRALIVVGYTLLFCVALPIDLWCLGRAVDQALGWAMGATWLGALPAAWGGWLLVGGMRALRRDGGGWPIGVLPPPRLVTGGPYGLVRHPIYLGFDALLLGVGLLAGSAGTAFVVAPLFAPAWVLYALVEERGLARRFGPTWRRYTRRVGWWPRASFLPVVRALAALRVLRVRVVGARHVPRRGPVVLVANHAAYTDPLWLALATPRRVWMATTAEVYRRRGGFGFLVRRWPAFPVRRYRPDPTAARTLLDLLAAGEVVGLFNERERSVLGRYLGVDPGVTNPLARLGVTVVPVAILDSYASGPRWAGTMRLPTVRVTIGPAIALAAGGDLTAAIDHALRGLLEEDPQRVWLERQPLERLHLAVWRCPACLDERGWRAAALRCERCGAGFAPSGDGRIRWPDGRVTSFAAWAERVWAAPDPLPIEVAARALRDVDPPGAIGPLRDEGEVRLRLDPGGLRWAGHALAAADVRSTSTERADTLQVAARGGEMWQFVIAGVSPFRLRIALDRLRGVVTPGVPRAPAGRAPPARPREAVARLSTSPRSRPPPRRAAARR